MKKVIIFNDLITDFFIKPLNPKLRQRLELLNLNENFIKEFLSLQKKYRNSIKKSKEVADKMIKIIQKYPNVFGKNYYEFIDYLLNNKEGPLWDNIIENTPIKKSDKKELLSLSEWYYLNSVGSRLENEVLNLVKKYKLNPPSDCFFALRSAIYKESFPFTFFLEDIPSVYPDESRLLLPPDANFRIGIDYHPDTEEPVVAIYLYDNCSLHDIKKYWWVISEELKRLRMRKGILKRYYPFKNLKNAQKLVKLDKGKKYEEYYEPESNEWIKIKRTDAEKAAMIYGDIPFNKREKFKNRIRQIRYQYKKRLKS